MNESQDDHEFAKSRRSHDNDEASRMALGRIASGIQKLGYEAYLNTAAGTKGWSVWSRVAHIVRVGNANLLPPGWIGQSITQNFEKFIYLTYLHAPTTKCPQDQMWDATEVRTAVTNWKDLRGRLSSADIDDPVRLPSNLRARYIFRRRVQARFAGSEGSGPGSHHSCWAREQGRRHGHGSWPSDLEGGQLFGRQCPWGIAHRYNLNL